MTIWIIIAIVGMVAFILWVKHTSSPDTFAKDIAKTQLNALYRVKKRNPKLRGRKLYIAVIATRPTYSIEDATEIVDDAGKNTMEEMLGKKKSQLRFRDVVLSLVMNEYMKFTGDISMPTAKKAQKLLVMTIMVNEVIPPNL